LSKIKRKTVDNVVLPQDLFNNSNSSLESGPEKGSGDVGRVTKKAQEAIEKLVEKKI
jgi:hypothetical protein